MRDNDLTAYTETAIEHAAVALLWQASDASEDGNGFPIGDDDNGNLHGETQFVARVITEVPYLTEAVTAFVADNYAVLTLAGVTPEQCGHDIILTANHHGAGFWDRGLDMPPATARRTRATTSRPPRAATASTQNSSWTRTATWRGSWWKTPSWSMS